MNRAFYRLGACLVWNVWFWGLSVACAVSAEPNPTEAPRAIDPRLQVQCFAAAPEIVHPIGLDFDRQGRLLVIESHTHFRPAQYEGPTHDRVRRLEDTDGDGRADKFTTLLESTTFTMDLAVHPRGSVYVASRSEIIRLPEPQGDGPAEKPTRIVHLETAGNYPHNGLSGLAFDFQGNLYFGLGENLGASYTLIGADRTKIADQGEGGNVFWCTADGRNLRRVATGYWNPFGSTLDVFGRLWTVDNDPDAMPPCRLLHTVEGGDYGYQFRYGRSGRHPFQAWNGQLAGTLPMVSGTGEAPCEVLSYDSDGLPAEYVGDLLVTSWADHRVERYTPQPRGASYVAQRKPFVQGGAEFRPVGLGVAPDGSLWFSDWVRRDYNLHGQGAIWRLSQRAANDSAASKKPRSTEPREAIKSLHRPTREAAARALAGDAAGQAILREQLHSGNPRLRATAVVALADAPAARDELKQLAAKDNSDPLRALAVELLVARGEPSAPWLDAAQPANVRLAGLSALPKSAPAPFLLGLLDDNDPFIRSAAARQLARSAETLKSLHPESLASPRARQGLLLAERAAGVEDPAKVSAWLDDKDEDVKFLAIKWIADRQLSELRPRVVEALERPDLNARMYQAYATALSRIDGQEVSDAKMADYFVELLYKKETPPARRVAALRLVPATHKRLTIDLLGRLLHDPDQALRQETVRALSEHADGRRFELLREIAVDEKQPSSLRAEALVGLAAQSPAPIDLFVELALGGDPILRDEALRGLTGERLSQQQRLALLPMLEQRPPTAELIARARGEAPTPNRPPLSDTAAWLARLDKPADAESGRRVFFHAKLAGCFRCHRVEGHGQDVGPDLTMVGRTERRHVLESILQPSMLIPPHYQVWKLELDDGRVLTGMLTRTNLDESTYIDTQGNSFKVRSVNVVDSQPLQTSIMPAGLVDRLTDQELCDLLAYLGKQR